MTNPMTFNMWRYEDLHFIRVIQKGKIRENSRRENVLREYEAISQFIKSEFPLAVPISRTLNNDWRTCASYSDLYDTIDVDEEVRDFTVPEMLKHIEVTNALYKDFLELKQKRKDKKLKQTA